MTEPTEATTAHPTIGTQIALSIENGEVTYRVAARYPKGFMVHVVWNWTVALMLVALDCIVLQQAAGDPLGALVAGAVLLFLISVATVVAVDETWWRRVCIEGREVIALRGRSLVHIGTAYGWSRQWRRPFDDVRRVTWRPRGVLRQYVSSVAVWSRFPNMYVVGWGLDKQSGQWLADDLAMRASAARGAR
jgi:hypothetical protein